MVLDQVLEGRLISLRSASLEDAEYTFQIRQDRDRTRYLNAVNGTVEDQRRWLSEQRKREGDYFFVVERKNGEKLGTTSLYNIQGDEGEGGRTLLNGDVVEIAEAQLLVLDFAFRVCGLKRVVATVLSGNRHVVSYNRKCGAKEVKRVYDEEFGCDRIYFVTTRESYEGRREKIQAYIDVLLEEEKL